LRDIIGLFLSILWHLVLFSLRELLYNTRIRNTPTLIKGVFDSVMSYEKVVSCELCVVRRKINYLLKTIRKPPISLYLS